jgi:hypothetical protein
MDPKSSFNRFLRIFLVILLILGLFPSTALAEGANGSAILSNTTPSSMHGALAYLVRITVKNTGTSVWTAAQGYKLVPATGRDPFTSVKSIPLSPDDAIRPGEAKTFLLYLKAPLNEGRYTTRWRMSKGSKKFGATAKKTVSVHIPRMSSEVIGLSKALTVAPQTAFKLSVTFKNTGSVRWKKSSGFKLTATITSAAGTITQVFPLASGDSIRTGNKKKFIVSLTLPREGDYTVTFRMSCNGTAFGSKPSVKVKAAYTSAQLAKQAAEAVKRAEQTHKKSDVDAAQTLIDRMGAGADKTALQKRLDAVNAGIDLNTYKTTAHTALAKALAKYISADYGAAAWSSINTAKTAGDSAIDAAKTAAGVDTALKNATDAMAAVKSLLHMATDAVEKAEGSLSQADVDAARTLVNGLPAGAARSALATRLNAVQAGIDTLSAINARKAACHTLLQTAYNGYTQTDYSTNAWTTLGAAKTAGDNAIDAAGTISAVNFAYDNAIAAMAAVKTLLQTATDAVVKAEGSLLQADYDAALVSIANLPEGSARSALLSRLDAVQYAIDALTLLNARKAECHTLLQTAYNGYTQSDYSSGAWASLDAAKTAGDNAIDAAGTISAANTALGNAIAAMAAILKKLPEAQAAVAKAELSMSQADLDAARTLVNALPQGADKTSLSARLDAVELTLTKAYAHDYVTSVMATYSQANYSAEKWSSILSLRTAVDTNIDNATSIYDLQTLCQNFEYSLSSIPTLWQQAALAVTKAENGFVQADIDAARALVSQLPNESDRNYMNGRLDAAQAVRSAVDAVMKADSTRLQSDVDAAQALVTALPDSDFKAQLQSMLDAVKSQIAAAALIGPALEKAEASLLQEDLNAVYTLMTQAGSTTELMNLYGPRILLVYQKIDTLSILDKVLGTQYIETDYSPENWTLMQGYVAAASSAVHSATTVSEINSIMTDLGITLSGIPKLP